jgi:hypothetical protein
MAGYHLLKEKMGHSQEDPIMLTSKFPMFLKLHSQLKKDVANVYLKGNIEAYPSNIHKALTLMNEYEQLTLDVAPMPAQGTAFATTSQKGKGKKASGRTKYIKSSASAKSAKMMKSISKTMKSLEKDSRWLKKSVSALQKCKEDNDDDLSISSAEGLSHFQKGLMTLEESYPSIALALKSSKSLDLDLRYVLLLDNQSMFDLCCNKSFMSRIKEASCALNMTSHGGGLKITCPKPYWR